MSSDPDKRADKSPDESPDKTAELEAEIEALRAEIETQKTTPSYRWTSLWRPVVVGILLIALAILGPLSIVSAWAHRIVGDTDKYVEVVTPLAEDPAIQEAITTRITDEVFNHIDVKELTGSAITALEARGVPPTAVASLQALTIPLEQAIHSFVHDRIEAIVQSETFENAWVAANREAHSQMVVALTGEGGDGTVSVEGETVQVNLAALISTVKSELLDSGFNVASRIPEVNATFTIFESEDLTKAQNGFRLLEKLSTALPLVCLVIAGIAIAVARNRRLAVIGVGLSVAFGMIALGLALTIARPLYVDAIPGGDAAQLAAESVFDTLVGFIRTNLRGVLLLGLLVALAAWLSGPSTGARQIRSLATGGVDRLRHSRTSAVSTGAFGVALWNARNFLRIGLVALVAIVLLFKDPVTGKDVIWSVVLALLAWLVIELLASPPADDGADDAASEEATA